MNEDFDESILDNEEEFNKRFKRIDRKDIPIAAINKSLRDSRQGHSEEYFGDFRDYWYNPDFLELMAKRWDLANVKTLLDVGCGQCHWTRIVSSFLKKGAAVFAVDSDPKWAKENNDLHEFFAEGEISFHICDCWRAPRTASSAPHRSLSPRPCCHAETRLLPPHRHIGSSARRLQPRREEARSGSRKRAICVLLTGLRETRLRSRADA